ncbi:MAG: hypothetical protein IT373_01570 [Polyangiaceae bacterium]|nr:hypothetical protein [Polyangiaceae bacterium]
MSIKLWLSVSAWGYDPAREVFVREAIEAVLRDEGLGDLVGPNLGAALGGFDLVAGGRMLRGGSSAPVAFRCGGPCEDRVEAALARRVAAANGAACGATFEAIDDDDLEVHPGAPPLRCREIHRALHAVENALRHLVLREQSAGLAPATSFLVARYFELPAWQQREAMIELLGDQPVAAVERILCDILAAPEAEPGTSRHRAQSRARTALEGHARAR